MRILAEERRVRCPENRLLSLLEPGDRERLKAHLTHVTLEYKKLLYGERKRIEHVYFLEEGVASLVNTMRDGHAAEVGTIGNEGVVGFPVLMEDDESPTSVYIQVPGSGLRIETATFREELERSVKMRTVFLRYAHAFFNQVAQSAACAHLHLLEQRCARWLLMTRERMPSDEFLLTHEFLSMMLGVRRAGVTEAAGALQRDGLIRYRQGHVTILDREGLEARSCECYAVTKAEFDRLLGPLPAEAG
jgi:CRP-like cAMP-binding protein